ncbi:aldose 1-epimerase [Glacieibacterium frigidum]|uniref:Aldose 1-epimerase n=1 Tax=Glacieibacterium frigidum TaxID=2593303 RepID=A0A552UFH9_9SPHN|nr:aldose 1-epimerase [Glacieibacterium frigidum]TRW16975.1 aldose 1-epimerase [Glacieibacterium frigidum]
MRLASGDTELVLAPEVGGSIAAFRWRGIDVMRASGDEAVAARDPLGLACFPLVPYSNRIAHGRFVWNGREVRLPRNFGTHPHAIHGLAWQAPWAGTANDTTASLAYAHDGSVWPWAFDARQDFTVTDDGFDVALSVTNRDATDMPAGLGLHPYFPNPPATRLTAKLDGWWRTDAFVMPLGHVAEVGDDWSHRLHGRTTTDHVFTGPAGPVALDWPTHRLTFTASANAQWLVVYAPTGDSITAVEPVTHPTDALNLSGQPGVARLAPGETLTLTVAYRVSPAGTSA